VPRVRRVALEDEGCSVTLSNGQVRSVAFADYAHLSDAEIEALVAGVTLQDGDMLRVHIFSRAPWSVALLVVDAGTTVPPDWWVSG